MDEEILRHRVNHTDSTAKNPHIQTIASSAGSWCPKLAENWETAGLEVRETTCHAGCVKGRLNSSSAK
jgi:hypothetical protein